MTVFFRFNATLGGLPRTTLAQNTGPRVGFSVTLRALGCETAHSSITIDDAGGNFSADDLAAFRGFMIEETACSDSVLFMGNLWDRTVSRGEDEMPSLRLGDDRKWTLDVVDFNFQARRRIITGSDGNRPAEKDTERIAWLLGSDYSFNFEDLGDGLVDSTGGVDMDKVDYRGRYPADVIEDCMAASGRNAFIYPSQVGGTGSSAWTAGFAYFKPTSSTYTSTLKISNLLSDVDGTTVFAASADTNLKSDPTRLYSGLYLRYSGGAVFRSRPATSDIYGHLDAAIDDPDIKTEAKAIAAADRYLADYSFEEDIIETTIQIAPAQVNLIREGMRVQFKSTEIPGYSSYTWRRVAERTVTQISDELYQVTLELHDPRLINGTLGAGPPSPGDTNSQVPPTAASAPTIVQTDGPASNVNTTFASTPTPGGLIVAALATSPDFNTTLIGTDGWTIAAHAFDTNPAVIILWRIVQPGDTQYPVYSSFEAAWELSSATGWDADPVSVFATNTGGGGTTLVSVTLPTAPTNAFTLAVLENRDGNTPGPSFTGSPSAGWTQFGSDGGVNEHLRVAFLTGGTGTASKQGVYGFGGSGAYEWAAAAVAIVATGAEASGPATGQPNSRPEYATPSADGTTTTFSTAYPYRPGTLKVFVDNIDETGAITATDPAAGTFTLGFAPRAGEQITVEYLGA